MKNAQKSQGVKSKGISDFVEINHLGQVKIALIHKIGRWIWVNTKKYEGILRRRIAHLKWGQMRRKQIKIKKKKENK